jgi:peptidoglycan/xylan/chitin deacetylase (PgdA/CDA1 family)
MARHLVCLTFDFDNTSSAIARGQTTPTMLSRGDFGVVGAARILELLERHSIRSTWFIPGHTIESYPDACRAVVRAGHEIGHHGWTHRVPASLTREEEAAELERGNAAIEAIAGRRARGYRSPAWDLSPWSIDLLLEQGFLYDSSLMGDDYLPYQARVGDVAELEQPLRFGQDSPLVEMPISWSLDDYPVFEYSRSAAGVLPGLMNARLVGENWLGDFRYMARQDWGVITYTFHPHVIGRGHRMLMLEALIDQLMSSGATFVAMEDAVAEYRERWPAGRSWGA